MTEFEREALVKLDKILELLKGKTKDKPRNSVESRIIRKINRRNWIISNFEEQLERQKDKTHPEAVKLQKQIDQLIEEIMLLRDELDDMGI